MASHPNRVLVIVVAVIGLVAVAAGVVSATQDESWHDRGKPEGVVAAYLSAVIDGDNHDAAAFLAPGSDCGFTDLEGAEVSKLVKVFLRDTEVDGDTAQVVVDVETDHTERHTFQLTRSGETWLIAGTPWPMYACSKAG